MLPGFRFLFAATVLTMSILVFGLGAAALLRAAHEEFASTPVWHATPETMFAQQTEATRPVLALLRIDAPAEQKAPDNVAAGPAPAAIASTPAELEKIAAPTSRDSPQPEAANPEIPVSETPSPPEVTSSAASDLPASADETKVVAAAASAPTDPPVPSGEMKVAAIVTTASEAPPPEPASTPVAPATSLASTRIATLGGPPVTIEPPLASADPDKASVKKGRQAQRAKKHRRMAARARLTAQAPAQPVDAFAQPQPAATVRSR